MRFLVGPVLLHGGSALLIVPGGLALMLASSIPVTLACGAGFLAMGLSLRWLLPRIHRAASRVQQELGELSQRAQEDFTGIRTVQAFGMEPGQRAAMAHRQRRYLVAQQRLARARAGFNLVLHTAGQGVVFAVLALGGLQVIEGAMEPAQLIEFLAWLGLMIWPLQALGWSIGSVPRAWGRGGSHRGAPRRNGRAERWGTTRGSWAARGSRTELRVRARPHGARERVVSPRTGPNPGHHGHRWLRKIHAALPDPAALRSARRHRVSRRPRRPRACPGRPSAPIRAGPAGTGAVLGYPGRQRRAGIRPRPTRSGGPRRGPRPGPRPLRRRHGDPRWRTGGHPLGGQRQRVSLARALASRRPTLLLDETLSAVDVHTERRILERLRAHRADRSCIVISQRLSALVDADEILFFDQGRVVERGTHEQLVAASGAYAHAWNLQTGARALGGGDR